MKIRVQIPRWSNWPNSNPSWGVFVQLEIPPLKTMVTAVCVMTSEETAKKLGVKPLAFLKAFAVVGSDPCRTYLTIPKAVEKVLKKSGLDLHQMDLIEIQEAFAAQVLADLKMMNLTEKDYPRINVNGSGISLGHPIACTGTRVLVTLLHEMKRRNSRYGLECICGGGGLGIAAIFERI